MKKEHRNLFSNLNPTEKNTRDRILLKRAVGRNISDVNAQTLSAFYKHIFLPHSNELEEKMFYLACLYCEQGKNGTIEVPTAWASYSQKHGIPNGAITRLIDSPWNNNTAMSLIRIIRRLIAEGYSIDMEKLATDVKFWNNDRMRLEWAKKISRTMEETND